MLIGLCTKGSGKTTQIPQFLAQAGWCEDGKTVAVTQVGEFLSLNNLPTRFIIY